MAHVRFYYYNSDPIKDHLSENSIRPECCFKTIKAFKYNIHYLIPFLIGYFILFDSLIILVRSQFDYSSPEITQLFTHLVNPQEFSYHGDVIIGIAVVMMALVYSSLIVDPMLHSKWNVNLNRHNGKLRMISDGKVLNRKLAFELYVYRKRTRKWFTFLMIIIYAQVAVFYFTNYSTYWCNSPRNYLMLLCMALFIAYANYSNLFLLFYFILTVGYIERKQKYKFKKIKILNRKLRKNCLKNKNLQKLYGKMLNWCRFKAFYVDVSRLFNEISAHNKLWSPYLTIYFAVYIVEITYLTYTFLFVHIEVAWLKEYFLFFALELTFILLLTTFKCSMVIYKNVLIFKQICQYCQMFKQKYSNQHEKLLKIDSIMSNHRLINQISFTLSNNFRINSQMFELIFSYISFLFMLIFRNHI